MLSRTEVFTPIFLNLLIAGTHSGNIEEMLEKSTVIHQGEADVSLKNLVKLFAPVVLILVGIYLGYQVISFWKNFYGTINQTVFMQ